MGGEDGRGGWEGRMGGEKARILCNGARWPSLSFSLMVLEIVNNTI